MKKASVGKRCISLLLVCCVVFSMLSVTVLAAELENVLSSREGLCEHHTAHNETCGYEEGVKGSCTYVCESCNQTILYSAESLVFSPAGGTYTEGCEAQTVTLTRGNAENAQSVTVLVYDNNADYGEDYRIIFDGQPVAKLDGATSVYDAFRDKGELTSGLLFDLNAFAAEEDAEESDETPEPVSAASMLAQLDDLSVRAATIPVIFAEGEASVSFTLEILDDTKQEYPETFLMAVLDAQDEAVESAQQLFTINDNESAPTVSVAFDCDGTLELDEETGSAQLIFKRTGNTDGALATQTLSVLYRDGEAVGYIDFAPWQEVQTTRVMKAGVYTLDSMDISTPDAQSSFSSSRQVTVEDNRPTTTTVPDGADPILDAVPDSYAAMPTMRGSGIKITDMPKWAQGGSYSNENEIVVLGSASPKQVEIFRLGGQTSKGSVNTFVDGQNIYDLNTSGTGSRYHKGYMFIDGKTTYDFTGIESVEGYYISDGVGDIADMCIGVSGEARTTKRVDDDDKDSLKGTLLHPLRDKYQGSGYVYYGNTDPTDGADGAHMYVPNGYKLNLRRYRFYIDDSQDKMPKEDRAAVTFYNGDSATVHIPEISDSKQQQTLTINSQTYGTQKKVEITYKPDSNYPVRLVGYKLYDGTSTYSELIKLNGSESFAFDTKYLKTYEKYCYKATIGKETKEYWTFHVIPIYEKIEVNYNILDEKHGRVQIVDRNQKDGETSTTPIKLYRGDYVEIKDDSNPNNLSGVWYEATSSAGTDAKESAIAMTRSDPGKNIFKLKLTYSSYTFQGVYDNNASKLQVNYAVGAREHGTLVRTGDIVTERHYVTGTYEPLQATAKAGYVTKWDASGNIYYSDTVYYKLDGNPNHNLVNADFVAESSLKMATTDLSGTIYRANTVLRLDAASYAPMKNATISVTANGSNYTAMTDANGKYTISGFNGVVGGQYSAAVTYGDGSGTGYVTFTFTGSNETDYDFKMTEFAVGVPYPTTLYATVSGGGGSANMLELTQTGTLTADVTNFVPNGYTINSVTAYFLTDDQIAAGSTANATPYPFTQETKGNGAAAEKLNAWHLEIANAGSVLTSGTKLYVTTEGTVTLNNNGEATATKVSSGLVNGGYQLTTPNVDNTINVSYDIPETPGIQNVGLNADKIKIPVLGTLDFSLTSSTGGFFTQRSNADGSLTLICGSSYLAYFGKGTLSQKYEQKKMTQAKVAEAQKQKAAAANADPTMGGADPDLVSSSTPGAKKPPTWFLTPAYLFSFTLAPSPGTDSTYLKGYEMALGIDACYTRTFPFTFYGVPLYVSLTFLTEAFYDLQVSFNDANNVDLGSDMKTILTNALTVGGENSVIKSIDSFIAAPMMKIGAKAGVGYNTFLSVYLTAAIQVPFIISLDFDKNTKNVKANAGLKLSGTVGAGADLVLFTAEVDWTTPELELTTDDALMNSLKTIQGLSATTGTSTQSVSLQSVAALNDYLPTTEELLDNMTTFSVMDRNAVRMANVGGFDTITPDAFKNTGVHLHQLGTDGHVMAFFLVDSKEQDTLNYLKAAYAVSTDCGQSWSKVQYVSDTATSDRTSLQYDINIFELGNRVLVTWSEANFDSLIKRENMDPDHLTPARIAKLMNAMNLKGQFFDSADGTKIGEAFTIAENSTIACGALDAVRNGNDVYVYYQRNDFTNNGTTTTLADLIATERTIAMAHATVNGDSVSEWTSTTVRAEEENGQEYRITEVEPFVHGGVLGEILVLDRDGLLLDENGEPSNEDRQLYLRTYGFDANGAPTPSALMAITDPNACAQSPEVVSNDDHLHLFWNQDGKIVYITDFVATCSDDDDVQAEAYVVKNADGSVTAKRDIEYTANAIAGDESLHTGTTFTASMDSNGDVLLAWISTDTAEKTQEDDPLPTDEIYGVVLETVTNDEAMKRVDSRASGNSGVYQLYAKGSPVALTDENGLLGALDSLCLGSDSHFLLAYSKLNNTMQQQATAAAVKTVHSENKAKLEITSVSAPSYPMPGSDMAVTVTVKNNGLGTADNVSVTASGVGRGGSATIASLLPGRETTVELTVNVPANFSASTTLNVTAASNGSTASASADVLYGAYFLADDTLDKTRVGSSDDCWVQTQVRNMGNASGIPTLTFTNDLFAVNSENIDEVRKTYTCVGQDVIAAGGTAGLTFLLEDTYLYSNNSTLTVSTEANTVSEPTEPDEPVKPSKPSYTPTVKPSTQKKDETTTVTFSDVATGSYYADAVSWAVENGITTGTSKTTFSPDDSCTRAQIVTFLWRAAGSPAPKSSNNPFRDVRRTDYFYDAVLWAVEQGITTGIRTSEFGPEKTCTRAQAVTFLYRYEQSKGGGFTGTYAMKLPFTDVPQWCYESVAWCYMNEITNGVTKTTFGSDLECTRAQIVTLLYRSMA